MGVDATTQQPRNNTRKWVADNEPADLLTLLDKLFQQGVVTSRVRRQAEALRHLHEPAAASAPAARRRQGAVTRSFDVYRDGRLALTVRDQPGTLRSTAPPPPGAGPPPPPGTPAPNAHPFLDGQAHDAVSEDQLGRLLASSDSFDAYLQALLSAGYDIAAEGSGRSLPGVVRLHDADGLVGAISPAGGRLSRWREGSSVPSSTPPPPPTRRARRRRSWRRCRRPRRSRPSESALERAGLLR